MMKKTESAPFSFYPSSWEITHYQDNCPTLKKWENKEFSFAQFSS